MENLANLCNDDLFFERFAVGNAITEGQKEKQSRENMMLVVDEIDAVMLDRL